MEKDSRTRTIISVLEKAYPNARIALEFSNPLECLVATMLSAQCTDARVNGVTKSLFRKYRSAQDYAKVKQETLEEDIRSTGFYRNKAKNIREAACIIVKKHNGKVPKTMEKLTELPGVARKTTNIVLGNCFNVIEGIAVDTHVARLSQRLGLTKEKGTERIEQDLMRILPRDKWYSVPYVLMEHGRAICRARTPHCEACPVERLCPKVGVRP